MYYKAKTQNLIHLSRAPLYLTLVKKKFDEVGAFIFKEVLVSGSLILKLMNYPQELKKNFRNLIYFRESLRARMHR